jgi:hypothetical protein
LIEPTLTGFLLLSLIVYSACGLSLSLIVNLTSFAGVPFGGEPLFAKLFWGIFPAFVSVILIGRSEVKKRCPDTPNDKIDHWGLLFADCHPLLRYFFWACFAYAGVLVMVLVVLREREPYLMSAAGTAFCMMFYAMGLAAATAAYRRSYTSRRPFR